MLEKIDLERVFKAARAAGFQDCELYAETRTQMTFTIRHRIEDVRFATTRGLALRCHDGERTRHFFTDRVDTQGLLQVLGNAAYHTAESNESVLPRALQPPTFPDRVSQLTQLFRNSLGSTTDPIRFPQLSYEENIKYFEVSRSPDTIRGGVEESAELSIQWSVEKNGGLEAHKVERARNSIDLLFRELSEQNPLPSAVRRSLSVVPPWPAPKGEIPILWSARALSKLQLQFLRAFEGDLVLRNRSFLNEIALPVALPFAVEDRPDLERLACDNEGSPRRPVTIFHGGRPKALACNNSVAEQLAVTSTGHCRRQSFQAPPTIGFWSPRIVAFDVEAELAARVDWGISVHDIEIEHFDPASGEIAIRLCESYLVHQGQEGEPVESVVLRAHLLNLLRSLECFSTQSETHGLAIAKNQQRFITEVSTPAAISRPLPIPGSVPPEHYW